MDRRDFLRTTLSAAALAGAGFQPVRAFSQEEEAKSRVVVVRDLRLVEETDEDALGQILWDMVHEAVQQLAGGDLSVEDAWRKYIKPEDVVAVKVNCIAPPMVPHWGAIEPIVAGCGFAGVPAEKVIVYDKEDRDLLASGYEIRKTGKGVRVYGTVGQGSPGYEDRQSYRRDTAYKISRIVSRQATAIINVPVVKDHCWAGITCALKNHFGSIDNPNAFHKVNNCCPAVIDVYHDQNIKGKQRLILCDAVQVQYEGGPSFKPEFIEPYCAIIAATDPVALDTMAMQVIDACRAKAQLPKLADREHPPIHVAEGAKQKLGTNDPAMIEVVVRDLTPAG